MKGQRAVCSEGCAKWVGIGGQAGRWQGMCYACGAMAEHVGEIKILLCDWVVRQERCFRSSKSVWFSSLFCHYLSSGPR